VNLGQFLLLVLLLGVILAFIGVPWWMSRRREIPGFDPSRAYLGAIDALIRGDRPGAIAPLRELARNDAANLGVYLRLGDLVRRMGYPERAYRLHADLLARAEADPAEMRDIHRSCIDDLLLLDRPEELRSTAEKLLSLDRKDATGLRGMIRALERAGEWERALSLLDEWAQVAPGSTEPTPAQMRIHMARLHLDGGRVREAGKLLEEAVKMPPDGPVARVFLGDLRALEGEMVQACAEWLTYVRESGYRSAQVFARLEKAYFEMGRFGDLVPVYEGLAGGKGGNLHAAVALADMHRRRGRIEDAVRQLESVLEQQVDNQGARRHLIGGLLQVGRTEQALRELDVLLQSTDRVSEGAACAACGARETDLWVRCDRCGAWQEPARPTPPPRPRMVPAPPAD
jgi:lipopolysaccharide biosynthesis regulator YciM